MTRIAIVGASVGGVRTAQALRRAGFSGHLTLIGAEPEVPYDKPPLSKAFLADTEHKPTQLLTVQEAADVDIDLVLGHRAVRLDVAARQIELEEHAPVEFDKLVIATGARARRSPWPTQPGVHVLRTVEDARDLRRDLHDGGHLAIVGAGFIGAEVAGTARKLGLEVTLVDPLAVPAADLIGDEVGRRLIELHSRNGVRTRLGLGVESLEQAKDGRLVLTLTDGETVAADTVLVAIGATPNDEWLESSGLRVDDGVLCDEYSRVSRTPEIYAVGDVARWHHETPGPSRRVEHWTNAVEQATVVAHNLTHPEELRPYTPVGYVWTDQHDWKIQIAGDPQSAQATVLVDQSDHHADRWAMLYHDVDDVLVGAVVVNWPRALIASRRALQHPTSVVEVRDQLDRNPAAARS
ncbi:MAG TPA: FAD-dependent oxidoreductase [Nocardioidaceae bacterium]|nr:FAD-dependent oxidoreductase [Nocardioidaceae bacterium]